MNPKGILSVDDTLLTHYGQHFEKIAYLYDSTQGCYVWAHHLVKLHDSDDQTDYPVDFRLWEPVEIDALEAGLKAAGVPLRAGKYVLKDSAPKKWRTYLLPWWRRHQHQPAVQQLYQSKLLCAQQMLSKFFSNHPELNLPVPFDHWYTQPACCEFLDKTVQTAYVGTLAHDDRVIFAAGTRRLDAFALKLQAEHQDALKHGTTPVFHKITMDYKGDRETSYSYCHTHRIHNFGKQRLVINHRKADLSDTATFFMSNQLNWQAQGITRIRRHRWPVAVSHEEGQADGLDQYQVRDFHAIYRHIALVAVTYSLLRAAQHDRALLHTLQQQIKTRLDGSAGSCRRHTQAQALWALATFIATALSQGETLGEVMQPCIAAVCPNPTIKERLQVLRPDNQDGTYYDEFDLVPSQLRPLLNAGKVLVTNWHRFAPESPHSEAGQSYVVVNKGAESAEAFARRVLGDLYDRAPILVLNDEAHHAYRPAPVEETARLSAAEKAEREEATAWIAGLDRINQACGIKYCIDLSATPFYLQGSGYIEGSPFPWLVSDFGLVGAIESGIVKIPCLPVSDTTGRLEPNYFTLWKHITERLQPGERLPGGKPKPDVIWRDAEDALITLASQWKERYTYIQQATPGKERTPPVMIIVCDNTDIAEAFYRNISGEEMAESIADDEDDADDEVTPRKRKKAKLKTV